MVDLSNLSTFEGPFGGDKFGAFVVRVDASNGGKVDLKGTTSLIGQIWFTSSGADSQGIGSLVDLSSAAEFSGGGARCVSLSGCGVAYLSRIGGISKLGGTGVALGEDGTIVGNVEILTGSTLWVA